MNSYQHTHQSVRDSSPAMVVFQTKNTITLVNEDGDQWTDPLSRWDEIDGAPVHQWEVTTPDEVYMTDDMYAERDYLNG